MAVAFPPPAQAQFIATWNVDGTGFWNAASNWTPVGIPSVTANFGVSNQNTVTFQPSFTTNIGTINFLADASAYTFTLSRLQTLNISTGIANQGSSQNFNVTGGTINFLNSSSAANSTITVNSPTGARGQMSFANTATAANATIVNNIGLVSFLNASTAANAIITNNAAAGVNSLVLFGDTAFNNTATAGNANIFNNNGLTHFVDSSTAGNSTIRNTGIFTNPDLFHGVRFAQSSTAGNATIINDVGGSTGFFDSSTAGNATIITNSGGLTRFDHLSTGGNARLITNSGGVVELLSRGPVASAGITAGSIEGDGTYFLGSKQLTVGGNNFSTTVGGLIVDGGSDGGTGGSLVKTGTGTLTLAGNNTYTGGTTITTGTLQLGNGSASGSILGNVVDNSTFAINRSDSFTFGGLISGTGAFQQNGTGTTILTGTNTYTGATSVNAGMLVVNGSIANSATTVAGVGVLSGTGTVGALTVKNGGTFAPGPVGAPGTMTVAGNLALQSGALYAVQVTPAIASSARVTTGGTAALAGTVNALFASGSYATKAYTILTAAGGRSGTFDTLAASNLPAGFTASLDYTATDAMLNLTAVLGQQPLGTSGLNGNQLNVANTLNTFFNNGGALPAGFVSVFGLTGANLGHSLSLLSGETATGAQQSSFQLMNEFLAVMMDPFVDGREGIGGGGGSSVMSFSPEQNAQALSDATSAYAAVRKAPFYKAPADTAAPFEARWSMWGTAYGGYNRTSGDPAVGSNDFTARTGGFAAGLDYRWRLDTTVGLALAGGGTGWGLAGGLGTGSSDAFQAGVYATTRLGPAYVSAAFAYTAQWMSTDRVAPAADHLTARFDPQGFGGRIESGYRYAMAGFGVTPYAALQAQTVHIPAYNEIDFVTGGFGLNYVARDPSDIRGELGLRLDETTMFNDMPWRLRARAAYAHDWASDPTAAAVFQALPGSSFIVNGAAPVRDSALLSAGTYLRMTQSLTIGAKFDSQLSTHSQTYSGTGTVRVVW